LKYRRVRRNYIHWKAAELEIFVGNMDAYAYWDILKLNYKITRKEDFFQQKSEL